jgi:hypothetical protein
MSDGAQEQTVLVEERALHAAMRAGDVAELDRLPPNTLDKSIRTPPAVRPAAYSLEATERVRQRTRRR